MHLRGTNCQLFCSTGSSTPALAHLLGDTVSEGQSQSFSSHALRAGSSLLRPSGTSILCCPGVVQGLLSLDVHQERDWASLISLMDIGGKGQVKGGRYYFLVHSTSQQISVSIGSLALTSTRPAPWQSPYPWLALLGFSQAWYMAHSSKYWCM